MLLTLFGILGALGAIVLVPRHLRKLEDDKRRWKCWNALTTLDKQLRFFSDKHPKRVFPALSMKPGNLMFSAADYHEGNFLYFRCPSVKRDTSGSRDGKEDDFGAGYLYLGFAIMNDDEMAAFVEVYRARVDAGQGFEEDLPAPPGRGSFGGDVFLRLGENAARVAAEKGIDPATIPVAWDQAGIMKDFEGMYLFNHVPGGSNVLYLDGHVAFVQFSSKDGTWPMTSAMLETMGEFSSLDDE